MLALLVLAFCMLGHGVWGSPGSHWQDPGSATRYINALTPEQTPLNIVLDDETFTVNGDKVYSLRTTEPEPSLCDPTVKQHAGFLDISSGKHLFFWFFESRQSPLQAPLTLWLNGGPGGSSAIGLLNELGPCNIAKNGNGTTYNPFAWNTYSNMIFLDQPVNVGFSYTDDPDEQVGSSPVAAEDVYAFLQLFLTKYPEYASLSFHLAAESYGGTYAPHIAAEIHRQNKRLSESSAAVDPSVGNAYTGRDAKTSLKIKLTSVILANGHTDPLVQFPSIPEYLCDGPYAPLESDDPKCTEMRRKVVTCQRLIQNCYDFDTPLVCAPATWYCFKNILEPVIYLGKDPYDVRKSCEPLNGTVFCYEEIFWIQDWLNSTSTKKALGIDPSRPFFLASTPVGQAFADMGDETRNSAKLLPELIEDGIRLLVYAGVTDMMCNYIGNEAWLTKLENKFHDEFANSTFLPWITVRPKKHAGEVRFAGGAGETAGNVTFVKVFEAGHMAPYNQPEATLDLYTRWILNIPLHMPDSTFAAYDSLDALVDSVR